MEITDGAGVDLIVEVDYSGNFPVSQRIIKRGGSIAIYAAGDGPAPPFQFPVSNVNVRHVLVYDMPEDAKSTGVADTNRWLASGELVGMDGPHFPLEGTAEAHEAVRAATVGKVVIDVSEIV